MGTAGWRGPQFDTAVAGTRLRGRIIEYDRQIRLAAALDQTIRRFRFGDGKAMRNERRQIEPTGAHQIQHRLHVTLFGPAHMRRRIIVAALLVLGIVASRPVGTRDDELRLLEVVRPPRQIESDGADSDDAAFRPHSLAGQSNGTVRFRRSRQQHRIGAQAARPFLNLSGAQSRFRIFGAHAHRQAAFVRIEVRPENPAAVGPQQSNRDLPDQSQTDDERRLAQSHTRQTNALQGDGSQDRERRPIKGNGIGYMGAQVFRYTDDAGMRAVGGDALAGLATLHARATGQHHAGRRIAHRHRLIELLQHLADGIEEAFIAQLFQHAANVIRPFARFAEKRLLGQLHDHLFRAGGDDRADVGDEYVARPDHRFGHNGDAEFSAADVLN